MPVTQSSGLFDSRIVSGGVLSLHPASLAGLRGLDSRPRAQPMQNTETELYRDAIGMIAADKPSHQQIQSANLLATNGAEFNMAIWATIRLNDMAQACVRGHDRQERSED